jgi:hypothetical protein
MDARRSSAALSGPRHHRGSEAGRAYPYGPVEARYCSEGSPEWRQCCYFCVEWFTVSGLLHREQRDRLRLRQFSHSFWILYDRSDYETEFNIRRDSVSRLILRMRRSLLALGSALLASLMFVPHVLHNGEMKFLPFYRQQWSDNISWGHLFLQTVFICVLAAMVVNIPWRRKPREKIDNTRP